MDKEKKEVFSVQDIALIPLFVALITLCSFIRIPFGTIPFTLQTLGVFIASGLLGAKRGVATVFVYVLMGIIGLPVFGGAGGVAVLTGNAGGYITGFLPAAVIVGLVADRLKGVKPIVRMTILVASMVVADMVCMTVGTLQFMILTDVNLYVAMSYCVVPFIIPEILKIVLAAVVAESVKKAGGSLLR